MLASNHQRDGRYHEPALAPAQGHGEADLATSRGAGVESDWTLDAGTDALDQALDRARRAIEEANGASAARPDRLSATGTDAAPITHVWALDPRLTFLNHGSYGSTPRAALRAQAEFRERMERDPVRLLKHDLEPMMDVVREKLGAFVHANPADIALVRNATYALCTILRASIDAKLLRAGDEVVVTDHEYNSLNNELDRMRAMYGIVVVRAKIPFPPLSPQETIERIMRCVTPRTRLAVISHIASTSAMVLPAAALVRELTARGVDTLVDGAHSPGQIPVDVRAMAPTYFVGSGHKWLSGPKGSAFVVVRPDRQGIFRPLALSGRAHKVRPERSLFLRDYDYQGTDDYSAITSLPVAMEALGGLVPGGWSALMRRNHEMAVRARRIVIDELGPVGVSGEGQVPESMLGAMASIRIPEPPAHLRDRPTCYDDALQDVLLEKYRIVVPIWRLTCSDERIVRISAHVYNTPEQYAMLGRALRTELEAEARG